MWPAAIDDIVTKHANSIVKKILFISNSYNTFETPLDVECAQNYKSLHT